MINNIKSVVMGNLLNRTNISLEVIKSEVNKLSGIYYLNNKDVEFITRDIYKSYKA